MENILHEFNEKVISLMTDFLKNSMEVGGLSEFTSNLEDNLMQLGYNLTRFSLEYAEEIIFKLNQCLPRGLKVFKVTEPVMKAGKIAFAGFTITIGNDKISSKDICEKLRAFFELEEINIEKKSKKGLKTVNIKEGIHSFDIIEKFDNVELNITLTAGSSDNVNPNLVVSAFQKYSDVEYDIDITRNDLYNSEMELFR